VTDSTAIVGIVLLTLISVGAFIIGRHRVRDWVPGRDIPVALAGVVFGVVAIGLLAAPRIVANIVIPAGLSLAGAYLVRKHEMANPRLLIGRRSPTVWLGVAAIVLGLVGLVLGISRFQI
jgi:hypothetical protein